MAITIILLLALAWVTSSKQVSTNGGWFAAALGIGFLGLLFFQPKASHSSSVTTITPDGIGQPALGAPYASSSQQKCSCKS